MNKIKKIDIRKDLYNCCPLLNKECSKENCYINNGPCRLTCDYNKSQEYLIEKIKKQQEKLLRRGIYRNKRNDEGNRKGEISMKLNNKELEELLTINEQAKILVRGLTYCDELGEKIFSCMKNNTELEKEYIQKAHNNYLALCLIGLNQCNSEVFEKLDNYMDNEY